MNGLLDTCVIIDLEQHATDLPDDCGISSVSVAELAAGVAVSPLPARTTRFQAVLRWFEPLPFSGNEAKAYGHLVGTLRAQNRLERSRQLDLMIAATAMVHDLPLYTTNVKDFVGLEGLITLIHLGK